MKPGRKNYKHRFITFVLMISTYLSGCDKGQSHRPCIQGMTDDGIWTTVAINTAFSSSDCDDDDNLFANEVLVLIPEGPVEDDGSGFDTPIDSLKNGDDE